MHFVGSADIDSALQVATEIVFQSDENPVPQKEAPASETVEEMSAHEPIEQDEEKEENSVTVDEDSTPAKPVTTTTTLKNALTSNIAEIGSGGSGFRSPSGGSR